MEENIEKSGAASAVDKMLKNYKAFSVTKIQGDYTDAHFTTIYFDNLSAALKKHGIRFEEFMFLNGYVPGAVDDDQPRVYIIGSKKISSLDDETKKLIELVKQCPEGPVLESIKAEFSKHAHAEGKKLYEDNWGQQDIFPKFLDNVKKQGKKVLVIGQGPVYYNHEELKTISELFLAPILEDRSCSWVDD